ncbi:N-acetyltransferase family protein [Pantanalinema sp. GBBB05]|uniref:GNAT family N-acetyltransferase n=1 Tax=Pantanalinema sp. GBBB05 TaxID=2604139 RepID=UPI001DAA1F5D|nr:GNAT family N-acetyltransferase [Pantanalinema sp. GBBB05]
MPDAAIVRSATPDDIPALFTLIQALAEYENLSHTVTGNSELLHQHLLGDRAFAQAIVAEVNNQIVGYILFFYTYSTFLTKPGIYLEDLFVLPEYRRQGLGTTLLTYLAQRAVSEDCGRLEWSVLDWNQPAIAFYQGLGADILPDWRTCRVTGAALSQLAATQATNS